MFWPADLWLEVDLFLLITQKLNAIPANLLVVKYWLQQVSPSCYSAVRESPCQGQEGRVESSWRTAGAAVQLRQSRLRTAGARRLLSRCPDQMLLVWKTCFPGTLSVFGVFFYRIQRFLIDDQICILFASRTASTLETEFVGLQFVGSTVWSE